MTAESWLVLAGVLATPLVTYLVAARKMSGKIKTTEATALWAEADRIRQDYREQIADCREQVTAARTELATARAELATARAELADARAEIGILRRDLSEERQ